MSFIKNWFTAAYNLSDEQKKRVLKGITWIAGLVVVLTLIMCFKTASTTVGAEHPFWELVIRARLDLFKGIGDVPRSIAAVFMAISEFQALDNTDLGKRLWVWAQDETGQFTESEEVKKAKKQNAAFVLCSMLVLNALIFGVGR